MCKYLRICLKKCLCLLCLPFFRNCNKKQSLKCTNFFCGFALVQAFYYYLLGTIPFPYHLGVIVMFIVSIIVGISSAVSIQVRCISLLLFPMYCGTAGRGVLKVVVLIYVVAGPITNMGMNAREVVRVFACTTQLSYNLSKEGHMLLAEPFRKTALSLKNEMGQVKAALQSVGNILAPIEHEVENPEEIQMKQFENDFVDKLLCTDCRSQFIETKFKSPSRPDRSHKKASEDELYIKQYQKKLEYRCENQLTAAVVICSKTFEKVFEKCFQSVPQYAAWMICWPLKVDHICNIMNFIRKNDTCDARNQIDPGFGEGYIALKRSQRELSDRMDDIKLQYKVSYEQDLYDIQNAKETGEHVIHSFEEKIKIMGTIGIALNIYVALLFLRIVVAAVNYHDKYLTSIEYDNVYITCYFKLLDERRKRKCVMTLLPLKKMERNRYIDVHSYKYKATERSLLLTHILKLMLEVVTATTFVMLDRLFYEALDVVRQHAQIDPVQQGSRDLDIAVEGTGMLATLFRKLLQSVSSRSAPHRTVTNKECVPNPQAMSPYYYIKIYGGYLWILLLLYLNPYTHRLRRITCSYFYPRREKQRILHLYNDILKKRMKMHKTLRRKAVQAVRAYYLSGENLLSLRMKFPHAMGWLRIVPAARMTCLTCGETEPRINKPSQEQWHSCCVPNCPFVFCAECWLETGARCLACDPSLVELSDIDSLSEDDHPKY